MCPCYANHYRCFKTVRNRSRTTIRLYLACNAAYLKATEAGDNPPQDCAELEGWFKRTGAHSTGIGVDRSTDKNFFLDPSEVHLWNNKEHTYINREILGEVDGTLLIYEDTKWNGHLVAHLPRQQFLIDATADQANRPEKGIELPEIAIVRPTSRKFLNGDETLVTQFGECRFQYEVRRNEGFRKSDFWKDKRHTQPAVKMICTRMEEMFKS